MSDGLVLVLAWLDELNTELAAQEDTFGQYLSGIGRVHELKEEIRKLDAMRRDK